MEQIKIKSIKKVSTEDVYDIQNFEKDIFQNEPNFIIDDVLCHNCGQHAGGVVVLDKPVWEYIPVIHTKDGVATAFCESGALQELDELGITKVDCLAITVLEVISNAVDSIDEELVKIEEDGQVKITTLQYVLDKLKITKEELEGKIKE